MSEMIVRSSAGAGSPGSLRLLGLLSLLVCLGSGSASAATASPSTAPLADCDRLAAHPEDQDRVGPGVERRDIDLPVAIAACERDAAAHPSTPRFRYQLARLLFYSNQNARAVEQMRRAADDGYAQAQFVFGTFITRGRPGAPTDPCLAESYWRRSAAGGRQAARVQYLRYSLQGKFRDCSGAASDEQLLEMLETATGAAKDFYEGLLLEDLGAALTQKLSAPAATRTAPSGGAAATEAAPGAAPAAAAPAPLPRTADAQARAAWSRCAASRGVGADQPLRLRRFGETREAIDRLQSLILGGEKTMTATSPWIYDTDAMQRPVDGGWSLLLDADGRPAAVLRTTAVRLLPFSAVTGSDSQYEGKPVRPLAAWREVHQRYFERMLKPLGRAWSPDMPVALERFEVACRA